MAFVVTYDMRKISKVVMATAIVFNMCKSLNFYFAWITPYIITTIFSIFALLLYVLYNKVTFSRGKLFLCTVLLIIAFYQIVFIKKMLFNLISFHFISFFVSIVVISSDTEYMKYVLNMFTKLMSIILIFSIFFYILYLIGVPLPHHYNDDSYYQHIVYPFFLVETRDILSDIIPRFGGWFLEPGHLGSTAVFLLFISGFQFKKWEIIVLTISLILSLSLAAYGLFIGAVCLYFIFKTKKGVRYVVAFSAVLAALTVFFINYKDGDNPINEKIISRLEFNNGEMAGMNRSTDSFKYAYKYFIESPNTIEKIMGKGRNIPDGFLEGNASWKKYLYINGYLGLFLALFFLSATLVLYPSKMGFAFFIIYIICNMIRDYPLSEMWLYLYIFAIFIFYNEKKMLRINITRALM